MISYEDKILQKVLQQFDGMTKIEAFDVLHKIEILLNRQPSPIQYEEIKTEMNKNFIQNAVVPIGNNAHCYLMDSSYQLQVYELKSSLPFGFFCNTMYYTTAKDQKLIPLTSENIQKTFEDTNLRYIIRTFLEDNKVQKKNSKTKRLLLLELLDMVDPQRRNRNTV